MITLGKIVGVHGVKGWIKVKSFTRPEANLFDHAQWRLAPDPDKVLGKKKLDSVRNVELLASVDLVTVGVVESRWQSNGWATKLLDVDDRNAAELLRGMLIQLPRSQLPPLKQQEYYWADLIGLEVIDLDGQHLGSIDGFIETGANDVLVLIDPLTKKRCLIPYILQKVIKTVDLSVGRMVVDWDRNY